MKRPIVGITCSKTAEGKIAMSQNYLNSVWEAGAVPVFLAYTPDEEKLAEYANIFDGFLFGGGDDMDPAHYGEVKMFDNVEIDADRDAFELALYAHVLPTGKPILGICRGIQLLNVAEGGTLYQHIDGHRQEQPGTTTEQNTLVCKDSMLHRLTGKDELLVNSFHHQNIKDLAPTLCADAVSADGYIEAAHMEGHRFYLGVQWHPEIFREQDESMQKVFLAFVNACRSE
ncbi:MAG: gamma-glutamyl-gamma-aminobutyrate hydrolase family protein [Clostridia bacterium]|nr:gamma-glutamyl-gamma-aminobutyrate hydrolase family protein [Clostridia bacterium]